MALGGNMNSLEDLENAISLLIEISYKDENNKNIIQVITLLEKFKKELLEDKFKSELQIQYLIKELERTRKNLAIEENNKKK